MTIRDRMLLAKDEHNATVRLADWTPQEAYDRLTEVVERQLATEGRSLEDDRYTDGQRLGEAVVTEDGLVIEVNVSA